MVGSPFVLLVIGLLLETRGLGDGDPIVPRKEVANSGPTAGDQLKWLTRFGRCPNTLIIRVITLTLVLKLFK